MCVQCAAKSNPLKFFCHFLRNRFEFCREISHIYYLRQVKELNGGDNVFVRCVSVCLFVCVCAADRSIIPVYQNFWALNANSSKTVKTTNFKFDTCVPRVSPDMAH